MSQCQHVARRFYRTEKGTIVWQCLNCNEWGHAKDWNEFDDTDSKTHKYIDAGTVPLTATARSEKPRRTSKQSKEPDSTLELAFEESQ